MVGDFGYSARLARLPVELITSDGRCHRGVPSPRQAGADEVDATGYNREYEVGDEIIALDDVVEFRVRFDAARDPKP